MPQSEYSQNSALHAASFLLNILTPESTPHPIPPLAAHPSAPSHTQSECPHSPPKSPPHSAPSPQRSPSAPSPADTASPHPRPRPSAPHKRRAWRYTVSRAPARGRAAAGPCRAWRRGGWSSGAGRAGGRSVAGGVFWGGAGGSGLRLGVWVSLGMGWEERGAQGEG